MSREPAEETGQESRPQSSCWRCLGRTGRRVSRVKMSSLAGCIMEEILNLTLVRATNCW